MAQRVRGTLLTREGVSTRGANKEEPIDRNCPITLRLPVFLAPAKSYHSTVRLKILSLSPPGDFELGVTRSSSKARDSGFAILRQSQGTTLSVGN